MTDTVDAGSVKLPIEFFQKLPKTDLHVHLDGSLRLETILELAEDAARENVRYMEVRYSPMLHTQRGLKITSVVEAVLAGLRAAHKDLGIESNVILCGIRNISAESSLEMAELAVAYKG